MNCGHSAVFISPPLPSGCFRICKCQGLRNERLRVEWNGMGWKLRKGWNVNGVDCLVAMWSQNENALWSDSCISTRRTCQASATGFVPLSSLLFTLLARTYFKNHLNISVTSLVGLFLHTAQLIFDTFTPAHHFR